MTADELDANSALLSAASAALLEASDALHDAAMILAVHPADDPAVRAIATNARFVTDACIAAVARLAAQLAHLPVSHGAIVRHVEPLMLLQQDLAAKYRSAVDTISRGGGR